MFDYKILTDDLIKALPEELQQSIILKRDADIKMSETPEFNLAKKLDAIKRNFGKDYPCDDVFILMISNFIRTEGAEEIVRSKEFKEMTLITAINLLLKEGKSTETLKKINGVMLDVLGINIGESESCKEVFLAENSFIATDRSIISVKDMKEILNIVEEFSITKREYLLALEIYIANKEVKKDVDECDLFSWDPLQYTLQTRVFLEIEKKNNDINSKFDFSEYLDSADTFLKKNNVLTAAEMYKLLDEAGVSLGEDRDEVLLAFKSDHGGNKSSVEDAAKRVGLIPYKDFCERIKKTCL